MSSDYGLRRQGCFRPAEGSPCRRSIIYCMCMELSLHLLRRRDCTTQIKLGRRKTQWSCCTFHEAQQEQQPPVPMPALSIIQMTSDTPLSVDCTGMHPHQHTPLECTQTRTRTIINHPHPHARTPLSATILGNRTARVALANSSTHHLCVSARGRVAMASSPDL